MVYSFLIKAVYMSRDFFFSSPPKIWREDETRMKYSAYKGAIAGAQIFSGKTKKHQFGESGSDSALAVDRIEFRTCPIVEEEDTNYTKVPASLCEP